METRLIFDTIPDEFDQWRPRYCREAFDFLIDKTGIAPGRAVLELGPGTGQASGPVLDTGCDYLGIELGEHLYEFTKKKFSHLPNFDIVNGDFIDYDFGTHRFDMILSAATIQWIPERIAFGKTFDLLKPGGYLAMMLIRGDYRTPDEKLYQDIQKVYDAYFRPVNPYSQKLRYDAAPEYGFVEFEKHEFKSERIFTADEFVSLCGTHSDHIALPEPYRTPFFEGLRDAVNRHGGKIKIDDTVVLYLTKKPE